MKMEKAIFEFMFSTGCRIGEIVTLEKNHIIWSNQSATVRGKGDKERVLYEVLLNLKVLRLKNVALLDKITPLVQKDIILI